MKSRTPKKLGRRRVEATVLWCVSEKAGANDWYMVFAKNRAEALRLVVSLHYHMPLSEYVRDYMPTVRRIEDAQPIVVNFDDGQHTKTAQEWCRLNIFGVGPFISTTYEV